MIRITRDLVLRHAGTEAGKAVVCITCLKPCDGLYYHVNHTDRLRELNICQTCMSYRWPHAYIEHLAPTLHNGAIRDARIMRDMEYRHSEYVDCCDECGSEYKDLYYSADTADLAPLQVCQACALELHGHVAVDLLPMVPPAPKHKLQKDRPLWLGTRS